MDKKSEKPKKESEEEILETVAIIKNRLSDAAMVIRNCPDCTEGWHGHLHHPEMKRDYLYAKRCHCHKAWQEIHDELMFEFSKLKKDTRDRYENLVTEDALNWHHVSIPDEDIVSDARMAEILRQAAMLGNKFAQWKTGIEERW